MPWRRLPGAEPGGRQGTAVLRRRSGPNREEGVLLGPARAGLTLGDSAGPGGRTEVSPSRLPRSLEPSFRVGRGPGLCRPEPPTHGGSTTQGVAGQPCRGALVWMQACGDHVGDPLRMSPSEGPSRSPRVPPHSCIRSPRSPGLGDGDAGPPRRPTDGQ